MHSEFWSFAKMFLVWSSFDWHIIKNIFGWANSFFYITSYSRLVGSGLKSIFHSKARFEINERSWVRSLAQSFLFLTILKIDVLFANSFMLLFNRSGWTYIKKRTCPNMDPWSTPARICLQGDVCPFETNLSNMLER